MNKFALVLAVIVQHTALRAPAHPGHAATLPGLVAAVDDKPATSAKALSPSWQNQVTVTIAGAYRIINANGLPDHATGRFPNAGNPNRIAAQNYVFRVPLKPTVADVPVPMVMQPFGIAVNGVVLEPAAAEWWRDERGSRWQYEAMAGGRNLGLDQNHAHVQPNGAYHYHGLPTALIERLTGGQPKVVLVGWAADGFPIYGPWGYAEPGDTNSAIKRLRSSYRVKTGERPDGPGGKYDGTFVPDYEFSKGAGDLDECNGRVGITPEYPEGTFYYVLTGEFPFIPRLFKGKPDPSFFRRAPAPGGPRSPRRPPPPGQDNRDR